MKLVSSIINESHLDTSTTFGNNHISEPLGSPLTPSLNFSSAHAFFSFDDLSSYHRNNSNSHRYGRDSSEITSQLEYYFTQMYPGSKSLLFNSGMSALSSILGAMFKSDSRFLTLGTVYRKTTKMLNQYSRFTNSSLYHADFDGKNLQIPDELVPPFDDLVVVVELISNPFLHVFDVSAIKDMFPGCRVIVDFTLAGLLNGQDQVLQADVAFSSCTKYISGHNDVIAGFSLTKNQDLYQRIWEERSTHGTLLDAFSSFLLLRSLRTYDIRISKMISNLNECFCAVVESSNVDQVFYPLHSKLTPKLNFNSHQLDHGGSVLTFHLKPSVLPKNRTLNFKSIKMAPSFGSVDTLYEIPRYMSRGILNDDFNFEDTSFDNMINSPNLIRLSVGCEPVEYILNDLAHIL